ncbi:MAG: DUF192 domain-containing protein [Gemmatimonadota bacterium]
MTLRGRSRSKRPLSAALLVGGLLFAGAAAAQRGGLTAAATARVAFGADTVVAEVAQTPEERSQGLMYREQLAPDEGMLFIFPDNSVRSFWMQNTYLPLDIAFLDPSFRVVDIQQMEPMTTEQHTARAAFMYALEVNQGWFSDHGVEVGDVAEISFGR